jgi:hypothetical protein
MASIVYHSCGFFLPLDRLRVPREVLVTGPLEKERLPLLDEARDIAFTKNRIAYSRAATSLSIRLSLIRMLSADLCPSKSWSPKTPCVQPTSVSTFLVDCTIASLLLLSIYIGDRVPWAFHASRPSSLC